MTSDEARPANRMANGADGCAWGDWKLEVRAKAVSPLRSATAVQDDSRGVMRLGEVTLAGGPRCCGSQIHAPGARGRLFLSAAALI